MEHKFQINLRGIIELLSEHLYSQPQVFLRELLQNGTDAIQARKLQEPGYQGEINFEIVSGVAASTLIVTDNGIGLTEEELHRFLSTIGESSKRRQSGQDSSDYIGQFGIGLLSCFVVSDEIVVISRSIQSNQPAVEWRGRPDGTYQVKVLDRELAPGTQVFLTARNEHRDLFEPRCLLEIIKHYGCYLPFPIRIQTAAGLVLVNDSAPPWRLQYASNQAERTALIEYGKVCFSQNFIDAIPLHSDTGDVDGVAFVLQHAQSLSSHRTHRVYLKNMFLSERAENLLPEWAFFVKAVVNSNGLRPTASRESFYDDQQLSIARDKLGNCLERYLRNLVEEQPERFAKLLQVHSLSMKALALENDGFFELVIDWLPFETTFGELTFKEIRERFPSVRYVHRVDQFKQIARVAAAQGLCLINAGYTYHTELLEKYATRFLEIELSAIDPSSIVDELEELIHSDQQAVELLVELANDVLHPMQCAAVIKRFKPIEVPAIYSTDATGNFIRTIKQTQEITAPLWSTLLDQLSAQQSVEPLAELCLNLNNTLIQRLLAIDDNKLLQRTIEMLYLQALLMGQHPLSNKELKLLNTNLLDWINWGLNLQSGAES